MKSFLSTGLALLCLAGAGCESVESVMPARVRERIDGPTYRTEVVKADGRKTYEVARGVVEELGFTFQRGGPAQGRIEAISKVAIGESLSSARQLKLDMKLSPAAEGGTEVAALITEIIQDDYDRQRGLGTSTPLRDTPLYEVLFRKIRESLEGPAKPAEVAAP